MLRPLYLSQFLCVLWLLCVQGAQAQAPAASVRGNYEQVVSEGLRAYQAGQYQEARASFERAHQLSPSARTLRALGMTAVELRRYTSARAELEAALADLRQPLTDTQRGEVMQMLSWLRSSMGTLHVVPQPREARVTVDAEVGPGPFTLEAGPHGVRVDAEGYEPSEQRVELAAGQEQKLEVRLQPRAVAAAELAPSLQPAAAPEPAAPELFGSQAAGQARDSGDGSVLEQWWFWTAVGAVVVVGATVAIVAASSGTREVSVEPPATRVLVLRRP
jgi:tetratricopeptide (TPR) repeat protein